MPVKFLLGGTALLGGSSKGGGSSTGGGSGTGGTGDDCLAPADIGFLFDGTANGDGDKKKKFFEKYIEFAKRIVEDHPPAFDGYHYGAVVYSDEGKLQFDFEKYVTIVNRFVYGYGYA